MIPKEQADALVKKDLTAIAEESLDDDNLLLPDGLLDDEGYPREEYLKFIRDFRVNTMPIIDFIQIIRETWKYSDMGCYLSRRYKGKYKLKLHTLGWSGNEEIITEILNNIHLTRVCMKYYQWQVGGHYYFEVPVR